MPSRVVIEKLCDLCFGQDIETEATSVIMNPFGSTDLLTCKEHDEKVSAGVEALMELFAFATEERTVKKKAAPKKVEPTRSAAQKGEKQFFCKEKGCTYKGAVSVGAMVQHLRQAHGLGVEDMRKAGYDV